MVNLGSVAYSSLRGHPNLRPSAASMMKKQMLSLAIWETSPASTTAVEGPDQHGRAVQNVYALIRQLLVG